MAFRPIIMRNSDLVIVVGGGAETTGTNFHCEARAVTLTPDVNIQRVKTLCPDGTFADVDNPEWTLEVTYLFGTNDSGETLADFLLDNSGAKGKAWFRPVSGGPGYECDVTLIPGGLGGEQGSYSEQSVSLPVDGQPRKVAAAPPVGAGEGDEPETADATSGDPTAPVEPETVPA